MIGSRRSLAKVPFDLHGKLGPHELRHLRPSSPPAPRDPAKRSGSQKRKDRGRRGRI